SRAGVFESESLSTSVEYLLDSLENLGARFAFARSLATYLDKLSAHGNPGVSPLVLAAKPRPALVDGDHPPLAIEDGDAAAQRGEERVFHPLAGGTRVLGFLARRGVGKTLPDEPQPLHQLFRPGPLGAVGIERQPAEHFSTRDERNGDVGTEDEG